MQPTIPIVFINLKTEDVHRSRSFFTSLGFSIEETFSNEMAICVVINETTRVMLLVEDHFKNFTSKQLVNATVSTEVLVSLGLPSKQAVIDLYSRAISLGAMEAAPAQEYDFMYGRSFHDLDGHIWELGWMDMESFLKMKINY